MLGEHAQGRLRVESPGHDVGRTQDESQLKLPEAPGMEERRCDQGTFASPKRKRRKQRGDRKHPFW